MTCLFQAIHLVVAGFPSSGAPSFESASVDPEAKQHLARYIRRSSRGVLAQYKYDVANQEIRAAKARLGLGLATDGVVCQPSSKKQWLFD
jgi:hypothetical protein